MAQEQTRQKRYYLLEIYTDIEMVTILPKM